MLKLFRARNCRACTILGSQMLKSVRNIHFSPTVHICLHIVSKVTSWSSKLGKNIKIKWNDIYTLTVSLHISVQPHIQRCSGLQHLPIYNRRIFMHIPGGLNVFISTNHFHSNNCKTFAFIRVYWSTTKHVKSFTSNTSGPYFTSDQFAKWIYCWEPKGLTVYISPFRY